MTLTHDRRPSSRPAYWIPSQPIRRRGGRSKHFDWNGPFDLAMAGEDLAPHPPTPCRASLKYRRRSYTRWSELPTGGGELSIMVFSIPPIYLLIYFCMYSLQRNALQLRPLLGIDKSFKRDKSGHVYAVPLFFWLLSFF